VDAPYFGLENPRLPSPGLLSMAGAFAGAQATGLLGRSTDAGPLGRDVVLLAVPVAAAVALQLGVLRPRLASKDHD
jgi:hypothetical protein